MTDKYTDSLDVMLADGLVKSPDDFTKKVMHRISEHADIESSRRLTTRSLIGDYLKNSLWPAAALATSAALGGFQVIAFIFGIWIPATAG